eukprot:TRINITY_DN3177_c0_g1_i2.p1 TRINITY_DN3177_c0_g1~~TRINITY_DN3177_c0_g1_i2.p1  ORF type:complete len:168 (-),score=49.78 TRINITY_DN3177_c0_g1_i2:132-635(-)
MSLNVWFVDLGKRMEQLVALSECGGRFSEIEMWMGGLFYPDAFVTATRQATAQKNGWSLETLELALAVGREVEGGEGEGGHFIIRGLKVEGAEWDEEENKLAETHLLGSELPKCGVEWVQKGTVGQQGNKMCDVPVYLNSERKHLLFSVKINVAESVDEVRWFGLGL